MPALQPYGSSKLRPFGSSRAAQPDISQLIAHYNTLIAEERRLWAIVDKYDMNGKRDTDKAFEARRQWNATWRKINSLNSTLFNTSARERTLRDGKV